jgi:uncharacterized protein YecE (DUF72 family)
MIVFWYQWRQYNGFARAFGAVEVDSTFYAIPAAKSVRGWAERTPDHFTRALKLPQEITHERRFVGAGETAVNEFDAVEDLLHSLPADLQCSIEFRQKGWINERTHELLTLALR